jgi:hypothetical protein
MLEIPQHQADINQHKSKKRHHERTSVLCLSTVDICETCFIGRKQPAAKKKQLLCTSSISEPQGSSLPTLTQVKHTSQPTPARSNSKLLGKSEVPAPRIDCQTISFHSRQHLNIPLTKDELTPDDITFLRVAMQCCSNQELVQPHFHACRRFGPHAGKSCGFRMLQAIKFGNVDFQTQPPSNFREILGVNVDSSSQTAQQSWQALAKAILKRLVDHS